MRLIAQNDMKLRELVKIIKFITDKNTDVLNTNIVGRPLLLNEKDQDEVYKILDLNKRDLHALCVASPRLTGIGKIIDQFSFALPLLILSSELHKIKKELHKQFFSRVGIFYLLI